MKGSGKAIGRAEEDSSQTAVISVYFPLSKFIHGDHFQTDPRQPAR